MRNQWLRLLLVRCQTSQSHPHRVAQVRHLRSLTPHPRAPHVTPKPFLVRYRFVSSELAVDPPSDQASMLVDIFAKPDKTSEDIKLELDSKNVVITHDLILSVLQNPETAPDVSRRVFDWAVENYNERLSSKSFNWMLGVLGSNGFVKECWDMIGVMRAKGYGVARGAFNRIHERFEKDGLSGDAERLRELYASGSAGNMKDGVGEENGVERVCSIVGKIIRSDVWGDGVEKRLKELDLEFSGELVGMVLENLGVEPNKALIFFRWVEESGLFKHDGRSFNEIARVLAKEEYSEKFWRVAREMRSRGYEMERETYVDILEQFVKRKMIGDAVDFYEFAMIGENKPSREDCVFLLRKIMVAKELDMDLFMRVVSISKANGNALTNANLDSILKALTSVGRMNECNRILEAMEAGGYTPKGASQCKIAFKLSSCGETGEALEFVEKMASEGISDYRTWESLIKGYCVSRDLDEASKTLREMVDAEGANCASHSLDLLVGAYCSKNKSLDAYKLVVEMVNDKGVTPRNTTYKALTSKLLVKKRFAEALNVMNMMKNQAYPPDLDCFVKFLSRTGSAEDAIMFLQAMTCKRFPSTSVFLRLFEAYLNAGRRNEAQDFLAKCPRFIRNHADVLNLFTSSKSGDVDRTEAVDV